MLQYSKMYGDKGVELVKEAVRAGDSLAPFNEDSVRYALGSILCGNVEL
jgi:hypothetical protein